MTDATRIFEYADDKSSKFWEISRAGDTVTVRYGKTGTNGQTQDKVFADSAVAEKHVAKLIAEKTGKGYVERGGATQTVETASTAVHLKAATQKAPVQANKGAKADKLKSPLQDPEARPESLLAWLNKDDSTNRQLAKHPRASADLLEELSHSSDETTRRNVAANPNTLPETFIKLGQQFPKEFLANPALDLILMIQPALMEEVPDVLLIRLLKQDECPESLLTWAASYWDDKVQLAVAMNPKAPERALEKLHKSDFKSVREAVHDRTSAGRGKDPEKKFEQAVRERIESLKLDQLQQAWESGDIGLAQWPVLPLSFRLAKATSSDRFLPVAVRRIQKDTNWTLESLRVVLPGYPREVFDLSNVPFHIRDAVPSPLSTPPSISEKVAVDRFVAVAFPAVGDTNDQMSFLNSQIKSKSVRIRAMLASHAHRSLDLCRILWKDENQTVRKALILNLQLDAAVLDELAHVAKYEKDWVTLVMHPNLGAVSAQLLADKLLTTSAKDSPWYLKELSEANDEVLAAVHSGSVLCYSGKDPNRAALAQRPLAPIMALCAGPFIEIERIVKVAGSTDWLTRAAVARNPGTPPNILKKLCADPHNLVSALARCNLHKHEEILSTDISTDGDRFLSDRVIREIVERVEHESQLTILSFFCDDVWCDHLSAFQVSWLALVDAPSKVDSFWPNFPFHLFQQKLDPECIALMIELAVMFNGAAAVSNPSVKAWAAKESICPLHVLKLLVNDDVPEIAISAMTNEMMRLDAGDSFKQQLLGLRGKKLRALLGSDCVPLEMLEEKSRSKDKDVRCAIAANTKTPVSLLTEFSTDLDEAVRMALASNPSTPVIVLKLLSEDKHPSVRGAVAANVLTEIDVLSILAQDKDYCTRGSVAKNPSTPTSTLERLAVDKDLYVREALSNNTNVPAHLFQSLVKDECEEDGEFRNGLCSFEGWTPDPVRAKIMEFNSAVHVFISIIQRHTEVAENPATPVDVLKFLAKDRDNGYCLARNPSTPLPILKVLAKRSNQDSEIYLRVLIARNPSLSASMLEARSRSPDISVRQAVAMNASTPESVLVRMADEGPFDVEIAVAMNPSAPSFCRDRALEKWVVRLQRSIQREKSYHNGGVAIPRTPISPADLLRALNLLGLISPTDDNKALSKASRSKDWLTRLGVALHPSVTEGILKVLRQDKDPDVASAAAPNRLVANS